MPKPQRSTLDKWLDTFGEWDADSQEAALDDCALLHRHTKRRERKDPKPAEPAAPALDLREPATKAEP